MARRSLILVGSAAAGAWLALVPQPLWSQSRVEGVVYEQAAQGIRPLPRAFVSISTAGGEILVTARTDDQGRYRFVNLPASRVTVSASKPGYLAGQAPGRAGSSGILDCSAECHESGLDFELFRGAVLAGVVVDSVGAPVASAQITVRRGGAEASSEKPSASSTDDRGRFRIGGLQAGPYILTVQRRTPDRTEVVTRALNVSPGEQSADLSLTLGSQETFRIGGRVSGVPFGEGYRTMVAIRPLNDSTSGPARSLQTTVGSDGRFQFDAVPAGRYSATAAVVKLGTPGRTDQLLDQLEVTGQTNQIILVPMQEATLTGALEVAAGALPAGVVLRFTSIQGFGNNWTRVGASRQFTLGGLRPGVYRIGSDAAQLYVLGVKSDGRLRPAEEVLLAPGPNRLTVVAAADHSLVFGTVHSPEARKPVPHARIALRGERASYTLQADQAGRFVLQQVIPGKYSACTGSRAASRGIEDKADRKEPGCQAQSVSIAPSSKVELNLEASP